MRPARACDLCGCYTPQVETLPQMPADFAFDRYRETTPGQSRLAGFYAAIGEQFTHFGTLQMDGQEVENPTGQFLDSSITQFVTGYTLNSRFALQLNVPFIYRSFQRPEGFAIDRGTESGLGDISLLAKFVAYQFATSDRQVTRVSDSKSPPKIEDPDFTCSVVLLAGIKFPTGDTSRIKEEFDEEEIPGAPESGIHGHDLALGTGSYDGIFGGSASARYKNFFFNANLQFALRGDGLHQYDFANDLYWNCGPGYYVIRRPETAVGLQFLVSGEHKGLDRFQGEPAEDTGITSVFLGPHLVASHGKWSAEIAIDLPVSIDNTALQVVPDYRIRGGITISF